MINMFKSQKRYHDFYKSKRPAYLANTGLYGLYIEMKFNINFD